MAAIPGDRPKITSATDLTKSVLEIHKKDKETVLGDGGILGFLSKLYLLAPIVKKAPDSHDSHRSTEEDTPTLPLTSRKPQD